MPPSGHRQRSAHSSTLYRHSRRQDATLQASSASHSSQEAQITQSNIRDQDQFVRDPVVSRNIAIGSVAAMAGVGILIILITFILTLYMKRKLRDLTPPEIAVADKWSWIEVGTSPVKENNFSFDDRKENEDPSLQDAATRHFDMAHISTPPPLSPLCIDDGHRSPPRTSSSSHGPPFTFTLPSPVSPVVTRNPRVPDTNTDPRRTSLLGNCMRALVTGVPTFDSGSHLDDNESSLVHQERSWSSSDSRRSFSGPVTPMDTTLANSAEVASIDHSGTEENDKSNWELLSKLRRLLPSSPPRSSSPSEFEPSEVVVRRSFTSPAFFTLVPTANSTAVCLKPCAPDKRESITSNYILKFLEENEGLGLDLMLESLPPPAIVVSAPTASTLNLCRQSLRGLDQFPEKTDIWSIAYGIPTHRSGTNPPAAFDIELSKRRGDASLTRPPLPPKSRRRTFVQTQVDD